MKHKCYHCDGTIEVDVTCYEFVLRCTKCNRYSENNNHEKISILKLPNKSVDTDERYHFNENVNKVRVNQESLNCRLKELIKRKELSMRQALLVMGDFKDVDDFEEAKKNEEMSKL